EIEQVPFSHLLQSRAFVVNPLLRRRDLLQPTLDKDPHIRLISPIPDDYVPTAFEGCMRERIAKEDPRLVFILGKRLSGKSTAAASFIRSVKQKPTIWINCYEPMGFTEIVAGVADGLREHGGGNAFYEEVNRLLSVLAPGDMQRLIYATADIIASTDATLVLDHTERVPDRRQ